MLRGVEIVWNLGLYWSSLMYDCLVGRDIEVVPYRARQLRILLCDLGPSFIKAGQVYYLFIFLNFFVHWIILFHFIFSSCNCFAWYLDFLGFRKRNSDWLSEFTRSGFGLQYWLDSLCAFFQVLANRPDIIREDYMNELCILQDDVPSFPNQVKTYALLAISFYMYWGFAMGPWNAFFCITSLKFLIGSFQDYRRRAGPTAWSCIL